MKDEKNRQPESTTNKIINGITGAGKQQDNESGTLVQPTNSSVSSMPSGNDVLSSILHSIEAKEQTEWIAEFAERTKERIKRMPKNGYRCISVLFNQKFEANTTENEIKKLLTKQKRKIGENKKELETSKKSKNGNQLESIRPENKDLVKIKEIFYKNLEINRNTKIEERSYTKKIVRRKINWNYLGGLNIVVKNHLSNREGIGYEEIGTLLYTVQTSYAELGHKIKEKSAWVENHEVKIKKAEEDIVEILNHINAVKQNKKCTLTKHLKKVLKKHHGKRSSMEDLERIKNVKSDYIHAIKKRLEMYNKRCTYRRDNDYFEFNRKRFYRELDQDEKPVCTQSPEEMMSFWGNIWKKETENDSIEIIINEHPLIEADESDDALNQTIQKILNTLADWKAPGIDKIYNFFIKHTAALHPYIIQNTILALKNPDLIPKHMFQSTTYLIPKTNRPTDAGNYRPISCLSNLYKIITKTISIQLREFCELNNILSINQLGTIRNAQGAKEQYLFNKVINKTNNYELKTIWIDIKKAFDSVKHEYLIQCLQKLNIPTYIINFVQKAVSEWKLNLCYKNNTIGQIKVEKGILQGDSLSPLLFVLAIEPLSRLLNKHLPKVKTMNKEECIEINHLIFIDDIKLMSHSKDDLNKIYLETKNILKSIGLQINDSKTASNEKLDNTNIPELDSHQAYKYLGILEKSDCKIDSEMKKILFDKISARTRLLCKTNLNARNLFFAINEYAISLLNYYCGILDIEMNEYNQLDMQIRKILSDHQIHFKISNTSRLYLQRDKLGRGLQSTQDKAERILYQFHNFLEQKQYICQRKRCILESETYFVSQLGLIKQYLMTKYKLDETFDINKLKNAQENNHLQNIFNKSLHSVLFKAYKEDNVDLSTSSLWLKKGNNSSLSEALYCMLQDRNIFCGKKEICNHCNASRKTVDHLATCCGRLLYINYQQRHDEVLRCLHLHYAIKFGFKSSKKVRTHSSVKFLENNKAIIKTDSFIQTDIKIKNNKPDIYIYDKTMNKITLIEIGITSQNNLKTVESEKYRKYDLLAKELGIMYKCEVEIIPFVMTWDGIVTKYHNTHVRKIGIDNKTKAYIQSLVLKKTLEAISFDYRRHSDKKGVRREVAVAEAVEEIVESVSKQDEGELSE